MIVAGDILSPSSLIDQVYIFPYGVRFMRISNLRNGLDAWMSGPIAHTVYEP